MWKKTLFHWSCFVFLVVAYVTWGQASGKTCRSCVERVHLSRVNTQISFSLTKVMVQGVSLNNRGADACDPDSSTLNGTTREGKLGGHRFSCSVQYFNTLNATVKRIIKQQGHGACRSAAAFRPLLPLGGCGQICVKNAREQRQRCQTLCVLAFR